MAREQCRRDEQQSKAAAMAGSLATSIFPRAKARELPRLMAKATARFSHARHNSQYSPHWSVQRESSTDNRTVSVESISEQSTSPLQLGLDLPNTPDFNPYPIEKTETVQAAMQYYTQVYARSVCLGSQKEAAKCLHMLFPCLVQDVLWVTATVALNLDLRRRAVHGSHAMTVASLEFHRRAMDELRRRLSTMDDCASDGALMAIGMLITMSILQGDMKAAKSHVDGLRHLVSFRGGYTSLRGWDSYLRDRIFGYLIMWELTQDGHKIDPGPSIYPKHPFSPRLCRIVSRLPPGLADLALSGCLNCAIIRLLAALVFYTSKILTQPTRRPADIRKMLVFAYALSGQSRMAQLSPTEQILVTAMIEASVSLGCKRNLHWVLISYQQSRIAALRTTLNIRDMFVNSNKTQDALVWMGAVLVATSDADSDPSRLGRQLVHQQDRAMDHDEMIELCERYLWHDELSVRLARNLG